MLDNIEWLGHDSFKITVGSKIIFIDPWKLKTPVKADIILITHGHHDHFSPEDIKLLHTEKTVIVSTEKVINECGGKKETLLPGKTIEIDGIKIEGFPAYNVNKKFHPKTENNLGFIITADKARIYHAGDTDLIPEMKDLAGIDIALLPVSGTYVMTAKEAVEAAKIIKPKTAVPMHYGNIVGSAEDAAYFKKNLEGIVEVVIK